jgi:hypothetical protein
MQKNEAKWMEGVRDADCGRDEARRLNKNGGFNRMDEGRANRGGGKEKKTKMPREDGGKMKPKDLGVNYKSQGHGRNDQRKIGAKFSLLLTHIFILNSFTIAKIGLVQMWNGNWLLEVYPTNEHEIIFLIAFYCDELKLANLKIVILTE